MSTDQILALGRMRKPRACLVCSIVLPEAFFAREGCPNCEEFLELRRNTDAILECTSQVFEGTIAVANPQTSWVAKWQRLTGYVPGVYAVCVKGILPEEVVAAVEAAGVKYIPRDGSDAADQQQ